MTPPMRPGQKPPPPDDELPPWPLALDPAAPPNPDVAGPDVAGLPPDGAADVLEAEAVEAEAVAADVAACAFDASPDGLAVLAVGAALVDGGSILAAICPRTR